MKVWTYSLSDNATLTSQRLLCGMHYLHVPNHHVVVYVTIILSGLYLDIQFGTAICHLHLEVMFFIVACDTVLMSTMSGL